MREYVTSYEDFKTTDHIKYTLPIEKCEEIVRCRDCKHHENHDYWFMCQLPDCDGGYANWMVEPDGFCAWGERREG